MNTPKPKSIEEYIAIQPEFHQELLYKIIKTIKKTAPQVEESIRYNMPAFKLNKTHIYVAAYKNHIGMYPMYGLDEIENELSKYRAKGTKDSIHFPFKNPIPFDLIEKIVKLKMI
ncbi:DUF1801 domain-containing protein [Flavobacterium sp. NG2]|uniref:iron chaperone n=1 Tax=Flavobacterium sp. NG2 TaxID=3097547 RepID=UPI002A802AA5|nr:DUF1801 domain-containing protein [Flavobacterium sp. NG2]WPR70351.1 DUF1801 domain-containing protein [Flavobacterium sp. NG2]